MPFLNLRWALINTGLGHTVAMKATNVAFALTFFLVRVLVYGAGVLHILATLDACLELTPRMVSAPMLYTVLAFILFGFGLNLVWFRKIVSLAFGSRPKDGTRKKSS